MEEEKKKITHENVKAHLEKRFKEETLRPLHDECKEHPFWRTLSKDFYVDGIDSLRKLLNMFIGHFSKDDIDKCPHAILVYPILHNVFDCMLKTKLMPKYHGGKTIMESKAFGNFILCMQTALQIVHYYLDDFFDEDSIVSYEPVLHFDEDEDTYTKCTYRIYGAKSNCDGTYHSVRIITKDEFADELAKNESMLKSCKEEQKTTKNDWWAKKLVGIIEYYADVVDDLKNNTEKYYVIK